MKLASIIVCAGLFFAASRATADTTAVYSAKSKSFPLTMTVEIADNGNVRYQMSTGRTYGLVLGGVDYIVELGAKGPVVDRADDLMTAQKEAMAAFMPSLQHHDTSAGPQLVAMGKTTIHGRTGQAYGYRKGTTATSAISINPDPGKITTKEATKSEIESVTATPVVVVSDDPQLAALGKVMANQLSKSIAMLSGMIGGTPEIADEMQAILKTGAPISFAGMELQSVNHAPIDPKRFELPAPPETLDQIRERMKPLLPPPTAPLPKP